LSPCVVLARLHPCLHLSRICVCVCVCVCVSVAGCARPWLATRPGARDNIPTSYYYYRILTTRRFEYKTRPFLGTKISCLVPEPEIIVFDTCTMSVDLRSPGRITIFSLGRLSSPHHFYGPPAGLLDGRPLSSASPSCAGCAVRRSQHKEEQLRLLIHHAQRAECIAEAARHRCTCVSCLLDIACYSWCRMRRIAI
jgi:hypothetical protein